MVYIAFPSWFMGLAPFHPSLAVWTSWFAQSLPTPFASISRMSGKLRVFWLQRHIKNDKSILILNTFIFSNLLVSFWVLSWVSALPCHHPQSWPLWPGDGEAGMRPCAPLLACWRVQSPAILVPFLCFAFLKLRPRELHFDVVRRIIPILNLDSPVLLLHHQRISVWFQNCNSLSTSRC